MKFLLSIFLILGLIGCSGSKSVNDVDESADGVELADADEFSEDADDAIEDELGEDTEGEIADDSDGFEVESSEVTSELMDAPAAAQVEINSNEEGSYTVSKNETLMMIAFKIYGDYDKWRDLARLNSDALNGSYQITAGMNLRYTTPSESFTWSPDGNPYLIKVGDTLGTISSDTYGVQKYWKNIWSNNKPLIKDPNKIFAGFTIYTPIIDGRDVANNQ